MQCQGEISDDFRVGSGLLMKQDSDYVLQTQTYTLLSQYNQKMEQAQERQKLQEDSVLRLIRLGGSEFENKCGKSFKMSLLYEFELKTLQDELLTKQHGFNEQEQVSLLESVLSALVVFSSQGVQHGFIQPSTIFLRPHGNYALNDIEFMTGNNEYRSFIKSICYLSPELFSELGKRMEYPVHDYEKSEVFSLGVTLLECGLVKNIMIYDFDTYSINQDELETLILELKYSSQFIHILRTMLAVDSRNRATYEELAMNLKTHYNKTQPLELLNKYKKVKNEKRSLSPLSFRLNTRVSDMAYFDQSPNKRLIQSMKVNKPQSTYDQIPQSPLQKMKLKKQMSKSPIRTEKKQPTPQPFHKISQSSYENDFRNSFHQMPSTIVQDQVSYQGSNSMIQQVNNQLPKSNVIYLHSGQSCVINDFFN